MSWYKVYKGSFLNAESTPTPENEPNQQLVEIYIYDTESAEQETPGLVIPLEMAENPLKLIVINNDETKFSVFVSTRAEILIHSSDTVNIHTFLEGGDQRWYVEIYYASAIKFKGWLQIEDIDQDWQPHPNEILLTATDGLGFIEGENLTNFDGENPENEHQIISYLAWSLAKTGLSLDIWAIFNIRERFATPNISDDSGDGHFFKHEYLDAKTFESAIGESVNCKEVIEKILGFEGRIGQRNGVHIIFRIDELQYGDLQYVYKFDPEGTFISKDVINPTKVIGAGTLCGWMNDDAVQSGTRPYKHVKLTHRYKYPLEIPCNSDFARGDFIADLPDEVNEDGVTEQVKSYELECWEFLSRQGGVANQIGFYDQPPIAGSDAYVKKFFFNGTERRKELVIETPSASGTGVPYVKASVIPVSIGDKIEFNVDLFYSNIGASTGYVDTPVMVGLFTPAGNIYWWVAYDVLNPTMQPFWQLTPATGPGSVIPDMYIGASIEAPPLSINLTSPGVPESGEVRIYLINFYASQIKAHYSSLRVNILPFINGSYQDYKGEYYKVTQPTNPEKYKAILDEEVFIGSLPRKLMKGCLLKSDMVGGFELTAGFYSGHAFPNGPPDETYIHPYGWIQIYDVWNQFLRVFYKYDGTVDHLDAGTDIVDIFHKFMLSDPDPGTINKLFMALHLEQDVNLCETKIFMIEIHDTDINKEYPANEFKYLTE